MRKRSRRLVLAALAAAVLVPASAVGAAQQLPLPAWMERMMDEAPPEMQQIMRSPGMQQMMHGGSSMQDMMGAGRTQQP